MAEKAEGKKDSSKVCLSVLVLRKKISCGRKEEAGWSWEVA